MLLQLLPLHVEVDATVDVTVDAAVDVTVDVVLLQLCNRVVKVRLLLLLEKQKSQSSTRLKNLRRSRMRKSLPRRLSLLSKKLRMRKRRSLQRMRKRTKLIRWSKPLKRQEVRLKRLLIISLKTML